MPIISTMAMALLRADGVVSNDDWHNTGLCWDDVGVKPANTWTGCPARQWKYTIVTKCSDMNVILKRSGCNVDVYVH
jgi:hypothetical protein